MFGGGQDVGLVDERSRSLKAFDGGDSDAGNQIGIFAIGFFGAAPARVACEIKYRRQTFLCAACAGFRGGSGEDFVNQVRIPGRSEADRSGIGSGFRRYVSVETFVVK